MARTIIRLIAWLLRTVVRAGILILVFITPWIVRFIRFLMGWIMLSVASFFVGFSTSAQRIAGNWTGRLVGLGVPNDYRLSLSAVLIALAYLSLLGGWSIISLIAVLLYKAFF